MEGAGLQIHADPDDCIVCLDGSVPCYVGPVSAHRAFRGAHPDEHCEVLEAKKRLRGLIIERSKETW